MNQTTQEAIKKALPPRSRVDSALNDGRSNALLDQVLASRRGANPDAHKSAKPNPNQVA